ncbi:MAG: helix-turn-helix transcriptional regulator [Acidobacteriota bacterium]
MRFETQRKHSESDPDIDVTVDAERTLLFDGLRIAIANLRKRQGLLQEDCADRTHTLNADKWSRIEAGRRKTFKPELKREVLRGLGCSEVELWEEKVRVEREHYRSQAGDDEPEPGFDTSALANHVEQLYRLDAEQLPPGVRQAFHELRNVAVALITQAAQLIDRVKAMYRAHCDTTSDDTTSG